LASNGANIEHINGYKQNISDYMFSNTENIILDYNNAHKKDIDYIQKYDLFMNEISDKILKIINIFFTYNENPEFEKKCYNLVVNFSVQYKLFNLFKIAEKYNYIIDFYKYLKYYNVKLDFFKYLFGVYMNKNNTSIKSINDTDLIYNTIEYCMDGDPDLIEKIEFLIKNGANINANISNTALYIATSKCDIHLIDFLLKNNADINLQNKSDKKTPLFGITICKNDAIDTLFFLINNGASLYYTDINGNNILHYFSQKYNSDIHNNCVKYIYINYKSFFFATNHNNETPLDIGNESFKNFFSENYNGNNSEKKYIKYKNKYLKLKQNYKLY
jgi:hypothetical protein